MSRFTKKKRVNEISKAFGAQRLQLGKALNQLDVKGRDHSKGFDGVNTEVSDPENIPGIGEQWEREIAIRQHQIEKYGNTSWTQWLKKLLTNRKNLSPAITGLELGKHHPTKNVNRVIEKLKSNPADFDARRELITMVGKSGRSFSLDVYRALYAQAITACMQGSVDAAGLKLVLWAQEAYFNKFVFKCKEQMSYLESRLEQYPKENPLFQQTLDRSSVIRRNMDVLKAYLKQVSKASQDVAAKRSANMSLHELQHYRSDEKKTFDEKRISMFKRATEFTMMIRHVSLLHPVAHQYLDLLLQAEQGHALPYFLKARIHMSSLMFKVNQYVSGERNSVKAREIQETFKVTYHFYGMAVGKIGATARNKTEYTILIEYANLVHYFYKVTINILGIRPPKTWLHTAFTKALKALTMAKDSNKVGSLTALIKRDLEFEGLL